MSDRPMPDERDETEQRIGDIAVYKNEDTRVNGDEAPPLTRLPWARNEQPGNEETWSLADNNDAIRGVNTSIPNVARI
jgi:hypothetical protein